MKNPLGIAEVFVYVRQTPWEDSVPDEVVLMRSRSAFEDITGAKDLTKLPFFYRLAGQSGTGKTTQLLPAVLETEAQRGNTPVVVAVRMFAQYHPDYAELIKDKTYREKTNGFALKCLAVVLKMLIENGYMIVLDMTLLDPVFEEFVRALLAEHGYKIIYQIMAVHPSVSDKLIRKRCEKGGEGGRTVAGRTADYFSRILPGALEYLSGADKNSGCIVWTAFDKIPLYIGTLEHVAEPFKKGRRIVKELCVRENELLRGKIEYMRKQEV